MSRYLSVALLYPSKMGQPKSLETIMDAAEQAGYKVKSLRVGSYVTEHFAFWRHYDEQARQELGIAYEKQTLTFRAIEKTKVPIVLSFECCWRLENNRTHASVLMADTGDTAMFTQKQWNPEENAQRLLHLTRALYHASRPKFAWIERCHLRGYTTQDDIENLRLPHIYWANFFGPEYVDKLGKDFLINAPGWKVEELDDGGILYVLTPSLMGTGPKKIVEQVKAYFGVETVRRRKKGLRRRGDALF